MVYRPLRWLSTRSSAHVQVWDGAPGYRLRTGLGAALDEAERLQLRAAYGRVASRDNAYHALEQALRYQVSERIEATAQLYAYVYDQPVAGRRTALSQLATLGVRAAGSLRVVWGVSLVQSPYSRTDLQSTLSLLYDGT